MMARSKKTRTFTASTEAKVKAGLARWKAEHPQATISMEKLVAGTKLQSARPRQPKGPPNIFSIFIEYEE
jgi:hypothetical protein